MLYSRWIVLAAPFQPSRAEPEPVADECGFSNALSLLLARDWKVALEEVIRSQWSLSEWWNKCRNNQLMNSSLRWPQGECPLPLTLSLLDVQMWNLTANNGSVRNPNLTNHSDPNHRAEKWILLSGFARIAENAESGWINIWTRGAVMLCFRPWEITSKLLWLNQTLEICMAIKLTFGHQPFGPGFNVFIVFVVCSSRSSSPDLVNVLLRQVFKV